MTAPGQESGSDRRDNPDEPERVVIRDKRRIDPETGAAREVPTGSTADAAGTAPADGTAEPAVEAGEVPMVEAALLEERTADLQRLQAEYANYRRRAERERLAAADAGAGKLIVELLPVMDDLDRARQHGDLTGGLKAVADSLETVLTKAGVVRFGTVGDPFDPSLHEAVMHDQSADVTEPTCTTVMRAGYQLGERLLRPAMVGVSDPA